MGVAYTWVFYFFLMSSGDGSIDVVQFSLRMISVVAFVGLYVLLAVLYLWMGVNHERKAVKLVLKCLPLVALLVWFLLQWTLVGGICLETITDGNQITGMINFIIMIRICLFLQEFIFI